MLIENSFGEIVKERRRLRGWTQAKLADQAACATITVRKIEMDKLRPSEQLAERLADIFEIAAAERANFIRLARAPLYDILTPTPIPQPAPSHAEIGLETLEGRMARGYRLGKKIGEGPHGVVYVGVQPDTGREVAVKIILPRYANQPAFIRRFEHEAQLAANLEHPHIVPLYDFWREPERAYLIMRLLRGGNFEKLLQPEGLPAQQALRHLKQLAAALQAAQRNGIAHHNLKPTNLLLDEEGNSYLSDFLVGRLLVAKPEMDEVTNLLNDQRTLARLFEAHLFGQGSNREFDPLSPDFDLSRFVGRVEQVVEQSAEQSITASEETMRSPSVTTQAPALLENPYKGLRPFGEADAENFFGRAALIQTLLRRMNRGMNGGMNGGMDPSNQTESGQDGDDFVRFLAVVGPSGSGKSSVVRAGLIPALRKGALPGSQQWFISDMMPSRHPIEELAAALLRVAVNPPADLLAQLQQDEQGLARLLPQLLPIEPEIDLSGATVEYPEQSNSSTVAPDRSPQPPQLLLLIDQFEELFTLVEDEPTRLHFLESLVNALLDAQSRLRLVITLRADFMDRPLEYVNFGELLRQRSEFVLPLTPDELEEAIVKPTERVGLQLERGLVATILDEIGSEPGMLPLLQYALTELFERRQGRLLTVAAYQQSGGVSAALARRADEIYNGLDKNSQEATRQLFLRLITLSEGNEETRRRTLRNELTAMQLAVMQVAVMQVAGTEDNAQEQIDQKSMSALIDPILDQFGRYRLLTFDRDPVTRGSTVEVAHEALLRNWQQLRHWLDASRADIRTQRSLAVAADEWLQNQRDPSFLLQGGRLAQLSSWAGEKRLALTQNEQDFLQQSVAAHQQQQAQEAQRQARELQTAQQLSETERRRLTEQAASNRRLRQLVAGLAALLLAAVGLSWLAFNARNDAQANFTQSERTRLAAQAQIALENGAGGDLPALLALRSLQLGYSPAADSALLSSLQRGFPRRYYQGHTGKIWNAEFSPDGKELLTASSDGTVRQWDTASGAEKRRINFAPFPNIAVYSHDGKWIAAGGSDPLAKIYDAQSGEVVRELPGHIGAEWGIDFSHDQRYVATSDDKLAYLWDFATGQQLRQFVGHGAPIVWVDFSPDGRYLASASNDHTARLWDVQTGQEVRVFTGHGDDVMIVTFSADGRHIVTASGDRTAIIWDVASGQAVQRFVGHSDYVFYAIFSPDNRFVLTSSNDKTARLWDIQSGQEVQRFIGHTAGGVTATYSPDGRYIVTASEDNTVRLWQIKSEAEPATAYTALNPAHAVVYLTLLAPDGKRVLTSDRGGQIAEWPMAGTSETEAQARPPYKLPITSINSLSMTPDQRYLLSGDNTGLIQLWDVGDPTQGVSETRRFTGHQGLIWQAEASNSGITLISAGQDGTARLWEMATGKEIAKFEHKSENQVDGSVIPLRRAALSPNGSLLATGGEEPTVILWDVASGQEKLRLTGHSAAIRDLAFSADGAWLVSASEDNTASVWQVANGQRMQQLIGHSEPVLLARFSPDGRSILTGSTDQRALLWDRETGTIKRQFAGHGGSLLFVGFSASGDRVLTGDGITAYQWRSEMNELIRFACQQISRELNDEERSLYDIRNTEANGTSICASIGQAPIVTIGPTIAPPDSASLPAILTSAPANRVITFEFVTESTNIGMGVPINDVFVAAGEGQVKRPFDLNPETLAQPIYGAAHGVEMDLFEPPFDVGPYPIGKALGMTLAEWFAAKGRGTYTVQGERAIIDLQFEKLVPNGVFTLWCTTIHFPPKLQMIEEPCGAPDGSENTFLTDVNGNASVKMEIAAFPVSTAETIYEIGVAYHSDGLTHGASVGEHGLNAHAQLFYDFMPQ